MNSGLFLTRLTIWVALACYFLVCVRWLSVAEVRRRDSKWLGGQRWIWTAGVLAYLAHVVCAFHFVHGWSQGAAWEDTARQTEAVVGWHWGGGLWFNEAFGLAWLADVLWWWRGHRGYLERRAWIIWIWQGFFFFMVFNATVVFEAGPVRWLGGLGCGVLAVLFVVRRRGVGTENS